MLQLSSEDNTQLDEKPLGEIPNCGQLGIKTIWWIYDMSSVTKVLNNHLNWSIVV